MSAVFVYNIWHLIYESDDNDTAARSEYIYVQHYCGSKHVLWSKLLSKNVYYIWFKEYMWKHFLPLCIYIYIYISVSLKKMSKKWLRFMCFRWSWNELCLQSILRLLIMPLDNNKPVSKTKGSRRRNQANEEVSSPQMLRFDSDVDVMPPQLR